MRVYTAHADCHAAAQAHLKPGFSVMSVANFDTLRYVETLTAAGFSEPLAKAEVVALSRALDEWGSGFLATKGDISDLKGELANLKGEIANLKGEVANFKVELAGLRTELKGDIADVRRELSELKADVNELRSDFKLVKWTNVTMVAAIVSYVAKSFF